MLAERIFLILVDSVLDKQTGLKFTWFNLALRGRQQVQLLIDMTVVGQWYGTHVQICPLLAL